VHHIDLNFGCPVRKVTAKGGGSALPLRPKLFQRLVAAATAAAGPDVPVTVKLRMGLNSELLTFLQVGHCSSVLVIGSHKYAVYWL
jgi:tRNA-dihydrouridine synthase